MVGASRTSLAQAASQGALCAQTFGPAAAKGGWDHGSFHTKATPDACNGNVIGHLRQVLRLMMLWGALQLSGLLTASWWGR